MATELDNVQSTLEQADREAFARAVAALSARTSPGGRPVRRGVGRASRTRRSASCRSCARASSWSSAPRWRWSAPIALLEPGDACLVIDLRRYDRWVLDAARRAGERGVTLIALTDSALSPLALLADASFTVVAASAGPFDSHVATLALLNAMVAAVADKLRTSATDRLDRIEAAWRSAGALIDS